MAWVGLAMVLAGGTLTYSAWKGLNPWQEFLAVVRTGALPKGGAAAPSQYPTTTGPTGPGQNGPAGGGNPPAPAGGGPPPAYGA